MKLKYNYISLNEKVLPGKTAKGNPVTYAVPDVLTDLEARALIKAIESNNKLAEIVRKPEIRSGTPEWNQFWTMLSQVPGMDAIIAAHGEEELRRYRISRSTHTGDIPDMELFDQDAKVDKRPSLPSFQGHWKDKESFRSGAAPKEGELKAKNQPESMGTTFKQVPVQGKNQPQ